MGRCRGRQANGEREWHKTPHSSNSCASPCRLHPPSILLPSIHFSIHSSVIHPFTSRASLIFYLLHLFFSFISVLPFLLSFPFLSSPSHLSCTTSGATRHMVVAPVEQLAHSRLQKAIRQVVVIMVVMRMMVMMMVVR